MVDFIPKPVDFRELLRVLRLYLPLGEMPRLSEQADVGLRALDQALAMAAIRKMMPLLAEHKFDAFAAFKELKSLCDGTEVERECNEIGLLLNRMAFEQVSCALGRIAKIRIEGEASSNDFSHHTHRECARTDSWVANSNSFQSIVESTRVFLDGCWKTSRVAGRAIFARCLIVGCLLSLTDQCRNVLARN